MRWPTTTRTNVEIPHALAPHNRMENIAAPRVKGQGRRSKSTAIADMTLAEETSNDVTQYGRRKQESLVI